MSESLLDPPELESPVDAAALEVVEDDEVVAPPRRTRRILSGVLTAAAVVLVWVALLLPSQLADVGPRAFLRFPIEALVVLAVVLVLPQRIGAVVSVVAGLLLGVLTLLRVLDIGFGEVLGRVFNPLVDWDSLMSGLDFLGQSIGHRRSLAVAAVVVLAAAALLVLLPLSVLRVTRQASQHRRPVLLCIAGLAVVALVAGAVGTRVPPVAALVSTEAAATAVAHVQQAREATQRDEEFAQAAAAPDVVHEAPRETLLAGLRGKDVLVVVVESYGRAALEEPDISAPIRDLLDDGTRQLAAAGFAARSGYLTSPTLGGSSRLAHATLQSGLWVDDNKRYRKLLGSKRLTLTQAFSRAGWRTVAADPANEGPWPEGKTFYRYNAIYDQTNLGYKGPDFTFGTMPDQYTLEAFRRRELKPGHRPVMAEINLVSSHSPWTPIPTLVDWRSVGDGSVFDGMPDRSDSADYVWADTDRIRDAYGRTIAYSLQSIISFVRTYGDDDLVLVVLGDHQPAPVVAGKRATHDVPITVIAHDPKVLQRIAPWQWEPGLRPGSDAPVTRMDAFRDRFLAAFGAEGQPSVRQP